jgi:tellurite resistance protein
MTYPTSLPGDLDEPRLSALVEVMFLAAVADEELSADERARFEEAALSLTGGRLSSEKLSALTEKMVKDLQAAGRPARLDAIRARLPDVALRKLAFSLAVQVTAADGIVRTSERELLLELAEGLELSRDDAADLVKKIAG